MTESLNAEFKINRIPKLAVPEKFEQIKHQQLNNEIGVEGNLSN